MNPIKIAPSQSRKPDCVSMRNVAGAAAATAITYKTFVLPVLSIKRPNTGAETIANSPGNELANPEREAFMP